MITKQTLFNEAQEQGRTYDPNAIGQKKELGWEFINAQYHAIAQMCGADSLATPAEEVAALIVVCDEWQQRAKTAEFKLHDVLPQYVAQFAPVLEENDSLRKRAEAAEAQP